MVQLKTLYVMLLGLRLRLRLLRESLGLRIYSQTLNRESIT